MQLSTQQQAAVEYLGSPTLVVAGAGSGKTRTLTAKIAYLVARGYASERILAITFTNKAAQEMKTRLVSETGLTPAQFPWVRTFHSACYRLLKQHCEVLGYHLPLQIWSEYQQTKTIREILVGRLNADKKHASAILSRISKAKNSGDPGAYCDRHQHVAHIRVREVYDLYERELKAKNAVDFDNILLLTRDLLRDFPPVRRKCQDLFDFLLVDEYQDTNDLQEQLTRLLLHNGNLFCVGDDWQAIYSFRGSNVSHFLRFGRQYPDARIFRLEQNYRSADEIVQLANDLIGYNDQRMEKRCYSQKRGGRVEVHAFFDETEEARWTAGKLRALVQGGVRYAHMAVLYRTKFCSLAFEQAFRAAGIPYRMLGGKGFFERKEIMDLNCYLSAAAFPRDDVSFERIINTPKRGIGPGMLKKINALRTDGMSLQDAVRKALAAKVLSARVYEALTELMTVLDDIRDMPPANAIRDVLSRCGYREHLQQYTRGNPMDLTAREENIEQLIFSASQKDALVDYLEEAALIREDRQDEEDDTLRGVNLSTIHAAKGLEFKVVFVAACEEQLFPHWRCLESEHGLEEERRLMYVSVTRAEEGLYLSSASYRKGQFNHRSRFIDEITEGLTG